MSPRADDRRGTRPPAAATDAFDVELERLRRLAGLQVDTVARAVQGVGDTVGWDRLTALGTRATVDAQHGAVTATTRYLEATLEAAGVPSAGVSVPIRPGLTVSGRPVSGMFAATQGVVRNRMSGGDTFDEALDHSAHYLVGQAASEPHRIGRDGQLAAGLTDERFGRFRRVAEPGACDWCRMLATRGAVYLTAETAGQGRRYHQMDRCHIELVVSQDAIVKTKSLSKDWEAAIHDEERMRAAGAMRGPSAPPVVAPPPLSPSVAGDFLPAPADSRARQHVAKRLAELDPATKAVAQTEYDAYQAQIVQLKADIARQRAEVRARFKSYGTPTTSLTKAVNDELRWDPSARQARARLKVLEMAQKPSANLLKGWDEKRAFWQQQLDDLDDANAKLGTIQQSAPMEPAAAALDTNMAYQSGKVEYQINCTRCSAGYELRRRGYQVKARPAGKDLGWSKHEPMIEDKWRTADGQRRPFTDTPSRAALEQEIMSWPEGARGFVVASWKSGGAHIWNVERTPTGFQFVEAQTDGKAGPLLSSDEYLSRIKYSRCGSLRVDNMTPTEELATWVDPADK